MRNGLAGSSSNKFVANHKENPLSKTLEQQLEDALLEATKEAIEMVGYYPRNFLDMLTDKGAKQTAEELMTRPKITHGLTVLFEKNRLDLSVEAIVLENQYKELFTEEALTVARRSLTELRYKFVEFVTTAAKGDARTDDELEVAAKATSKSTSTVTTYDRSSAVKECVLENASGKCECCGEDAPFQTVAGVPFLELHHVKQLSDGGSDRIENAVAVCPNCHRALHYSAESESLASKLHNTVERLELE